MEAAKSLRRTSSLHFSLAIIVFLISNTLTVSTASKSGVTAYQSHIKAVCNSAAYPKECYKHLSPYASAIKTDPQKLYRVSLYVTIKAARKTSSSISSLRRLKDLSPTERQIIHDCAETVGDALDQLQQSLTVMANLEGADRKYHMENVRTWVSAALTNEGTCTDEFDGQEVCNAVNKNIKKTVFDLSKMTSNCLSLLDTLNC
ncbi:hypothetical protein PTKIN_Ptkin04bG0003600 [Pterospermum kingtungense]